MIEVIPFTNEETWLKARMQDITSTEVAALFGLSPYMTPFELFHRKKDGVIVKLEMNERMAWGLALQDSIAAYVAKEQGLTIRRMDEYMRDPEHRIGASFDFAIGDIGLMEIKNVDGLVFKNDWTEDEKGIQGPLHIEIQVQHQLAVSGREYCLLTALVGGNKLVQVKRTRDEAVITAIRVAVAKFWHDIETNNPPAPDFEADADFIGKLFGYAEPGSVLNVVEDATMLAQAQEYKRLGDIAKDCETKRDAIKAELLTKIGTAEKAIGDGYTISAGVQGPKMIEAYERAGFRMFRVNFKKEKKA